MTFGMCLKAPYLLTEGNECGLCPDNCEKCTTGLKCDVCKPYPSCFCTMRPC